MSCISLKTAALVLECLRGSVPAGSDAVPPSPPLVIMGHDEFCRALSLEPVDTGFPSWDLTKLTLSDVCFPPIHS